jgi:hypothetical protein
MDAVVIENIVVGVITAVMKVVQEQTNLTAEQQATLLDNISRRLNLTLARVEAVTVKDV